MSLERRIRALRAKAASTAFPEEADTARKLADKLEAKLKAERPQPRPDPMARHRAYEEKLARAWDKRERRERAPKQPWRGSPGDHDELYKEALERALAEMADDKGLTDRMKGILARKRAMDEMIRAFGDELD